MVVVVSSGNPWVMTSSQRVTSSSRNASSVLSVEVPEGDMVFFFFVYAAEVFSFELYNISFFLLHDSRFGESVPDAAVVHDDGYFDEVFFYR